MGDGFEVTGMFSRRDGTIHTTFTQNERALLSQIPSLLDTAGDQGGDPAYEVLNRPVYPDDARANTDLTDLVAGEVAAQRTADRAIVVAAARGERLMTYEEARALLRAVNEARLVIAARAGAFEDGDSWEDRVGSDPALAAVAWLGYVQSELIGILSRP